MEEEIKESKFKDKEEVIVIQYLHPSMSNNLLCKFPDNSAFDFDYSQSSIWSPLVPRYHSLSCLNANSPELNRRLSFEKVSLSSVIKKKISSFGLNLNAKLVKRKKKKMNRMLKFNGDHEDIQSPPSNNKGWKKALKMTSKQFKRKKDSAAHQHRHPISRVTLSDYLRSPDF